MNRATSQRMTARTQKDLTTGNAVWETPPAIFEKLNADFGPFDIDLTGDAERALCYPWIGPDSPIGMFDARTAIWPEHGSNGYSNPPYGPFIKLMLAGALGYRDMGFTTTLLLPMRVTEAFKMWVIGDQDTPGASELLFCNSRICFYENGAPRLNAEKLAKGQRVPDSAMFDSIIVRYVPGQTILKVGIWEVPSHV